MAFSKKCVSNKVYQLSFSLTFLPDKRSREPFRNWFFQPAEKSKIQFGPTGQSCVSLQRGTVSAALLTCPVTVAWTVGFILAEVIFAFACQNAPCTKCLLALIWTSKLQKSSCSHASVHLCSLITPHAVVSGPNHKNEDLFGYLAIWFTPDETVNQIDLVKN